MYEVESGTILLISINKLRRHIVSPEKSQSNNKDNS